MLLAIDIGNSHIVCGVLENDNLKVDWRLSTDLSKTSDEYRLSFQALLLSHHLNPSHITSSIVSSVVPPLTPVFESMLTSLFGHSPYIVTSACPHGLSLRYDNPEEIGTDRLVNAAAAYSHYQQSLIIVDFGTATTFCAISQKGEYLGGAIAPGLKSAADTLHLNTAKLPKVDLAVPPRVIGQNTQSSIQSGIMYGYAGLVDALVNRLQQEIGQSAYVLATGGIAPTIVKISNTIQEVRPHLTLEGLALLHARLSSTCG